MRRQEDKETNVWAVAVLWCPWQGRAEGESRRGTGWCGEPLRALGDGTALACVAHDLGAIGTGAWWPTGDSLMEEMVGCRLCIAWLALEMCAPE